MKTIGLHQVRHHWRMYALLIPSVVLVVTFSYYPAVQAMYHAFFRWNGDEVSEYIGLANFRRAINDPTLAKAFGIVMIFILSNFVKMLPSIATAVVIHRMISEKAQYLYRVLFVIPMIIPGIVWLLIWKFFYDPNIGILNNILDATGLMGGLQFLDDAMPRLADLIAPYRASLVDPLFGSTFGLALTGVIFLSFLGGVRGVKRGWLWWAILLPAAFFLFRADESFFGAGRSLAGVIRMVVIIVASGALAEVIRRNAGLEAERIIKWIGGGVLAIAFALILSSLIWTEPTGAFDQGSPAWLGHPKLALPAMIFWGFPWVGVVSVLLYLAGLGNIDQSVYEAADIDGCGWFRKFLNIELPLITTQIRLNLVLMIIHTLKGWGLVFIIWGDGGGPGGAVMLPGLYMFRKAFTDLQVGYGCAIGLMLFALILVLTLLNNKYVRVEK